MNSLTTYLTQTYQLVLQAVLVKRISITYKFVGLLHPRMLQYIDMTPFDQAENLSSSNHLLKLTKGCVLIGKIEQTKLHSRNT